MGTPKPWLSPGGSEPVRGNFKGFLNLFRGAHCGPGIQLS